MVMILILTGCSSGSEGDNTTEDISAANVAEIRDVLTRAGLSNVGVFEKWVTEKAEDSSDDSSSGGFSDADCRMTVMLLAGDSISYDSVEEKYDGDYLMFDIDAIENNEEYSLLRDKEPLFTTMFGEIPAAGDTFGTAFPDNWKKHGIVFNNEKCSIISLVFKTYVRDEAYVGHTGILIDCEDIDGADSDYLFVEKIAFGDPFRMTWLDDKEDLVDLFSARPDYTVEEDEPAPLVFENDHLLGELKR